MAEKIKRIMQKEYMPPSVRHLTDANVSKLLAINNGLLSIGDFIADR